MGFKNEDLPAWVALQVLNMKIFIKMPELLILTGPSWHVSHWVKAGSDREVKTGGLRRVLPEGTPWHNCRASLGYTEDLGELRWTGTIGRHSSCVLMACVSVRIMATWRVCCCRLVCNCTFGYFILFPLPPYSILIHFDPPTLGRKERRLEGKGHWYT